MSRPPKDHIRLGLATSTVAADAVGATYHVARLDKFYRGGSVSRPPKDHIRLGLATSTVAADAVGATYHVARLDKFYRGGSVSRPPKDHIRLGLAKPPATANAVDARATGLQTRQNRLRPEVFSSPSLMPRGGGRGVGLANRSVSRRSGSVSRPPKDHIMLRLATSPATANAVDARATGLQTRQNRLRPEVFSSPSLMPRGGGRGVGLANRSVSRRGGSVSRPPKDHIRLGLAKPPATANAVDAPATGLQTRQNRLRPEVFSSPSLMPRGGGRGVGLANRSVSRRGRLCESPAEGPYYAGTCYVTCHSERGGRARDRAADQAK